MIVVVGQKCTGCGKSEMGLDLEPFTCYACSDVSCPVALELSAGEVENLIRKLGGST